MWVLILTVVMNGATTVSMHDFNTREACNTAGKAWVENVHMQGLNVLHICVQK